MGVTGLLGSCREVARMSDQAPTVTVLELCPLEAERMLVSTGLAIYAPNAGRMDRPGLIVGHGEAESVLIFQRADAPRKVFVLTGAAKDQR
jgi:hypothetical protein